MPPKRSVVPDPKLSQDARGEPVRVPLTGPSQLDDLARDKFCFVISRTDGKLKSGACNLERLAHGFNVLGLESESMRSGSWHRGAAAVCGGTPHLHHKLKPRWCHLYITKRGSVPSLERSLMSII